MVLLNNIVNPVNVIVNILIKYPFLTIRFVSFRGFYEFDSFFMRSSRIDEHTDWNHVEHPNI